MNIEPLIWSQLNIIMYIIMWMETDTDTKNIKKWFDLYELDSSNFWIVTTRKLQIFRTCYTYLHFGTFVTVLPNIEQGGWGQRSSPSLVLTPHLLHFILSSQGCVTERNYSWRALYQDESKRFQINKKIAWVPVSGALFIKWFWCDCFASWVVSFHEDIS